MAERVRPPRDFEQQFSDPLWRRLQINYAMGGFTSLVEGQRNGYSYKVVDLAHESTSIWGIQNIGWGQTTTFFIIALPRRAAGWRVPRQPPGMLAYADAGHLYLAKVGRRPRVAKWPAILDEAVEIAKSLQELTAGEVAKTADQPFPNVWDGRWSFFVAIVAVLIPLFLISIAASELSEFLRLGYIKSCRGAEEYAKVLTGRDAWMWLAGFAASLPGLAGMVWIMVGYYNRRGFRWRLSIAGLVTMALAWGGAKMAVQDAAWKLRLDNGQQVPCFVRHPQRPAGR